MATTTRSESRAFEPDPAARCRCRCVRSARTRRDRSRRPGCNGCVRRRLVRAGTHLADVLARADAERDRRANTPAGVSTSAVYSSQPGVPGRGLIVAVGCGRGAGRPASISPSPAECRCSSTCGSW